MSCRVLVLLTLMAATAVVHAAEMELSIAGVGGTLSGSFQEAAAGAPIVVVVPGSGPSDRDGNIGRLHPDTYRSLADDLRQAGIATLRYDKYGAGKSTRVADDGLPTIKDEAEDVRRWVRELRSRHPGQPVVLLGHSEGALIAELAAVDADIAGLILAEPIGRNVADALQRQLAHTASTAAYAEQAAGIIARLRQGQATDVQAIPAALRPVFSEPAQRYFMDWMSYDPCQVLAGSSVRTLIIHGTSDLQVDSDEARRLQSCRSGVGLLDIAGMNHLFRDVGDDIAANKKSYLSAAPLDPGFVQAVAKFALEPKR